MGARLTLATFNLHAGMDGYGRRFDVVEACSVLEADVLVLEEVFTPAEGAGQASEIAAALGYEAAELRLAPALRLRQPLPVPPGAGWEPKRPYPQVRRALRVGARLDRHRGRLGPYEPGWWGLAVLTRERPVSVSEIDLGRLRRDVTRRGALVVELPDGLQVVGIHMAHSTHGSPLQFRRLRALLPDKQAPAVLAGDMNFWGPPIELALPGWRRAAKDKTWPAWRPRHQLDHIFVTPAVARLGGEAVRAGNSDHLPIRASLALARLTSGPSSRRE